MEDITAVAQFTIYGLTFNYMTVVYTMVVCAALFLCSWIASRSISLRPEGPQILAEAIVDFFDGMIQDSLDLGKERSRKFLPLVLTTFLFLLFCNWIGVVPYMKEPTQDYNTPLALALIGFAVSMGAGIKIKGAWPYFKDYGSPIFFMAPLNVVSEISSVVSISFRLFGNIKGGAIIILVVSYLIKYLFLPPFLMMFFGVFVGTVQAFVFAMLTLVYISVAIH